MWIWRQCSSKPQPEELVLSRAYLALGVKYKVILLFAITWYFGGSPSSRVKKLNPPFSDKWITARAAQTKSDKLVSFMKTGILLERVRLIDRTEGTILFLSFIFISNLAQNESFHLSPYGRIQAIWPHSVWFLVQDTAMWKEQTVH